MSRFLSITGALLGAATWFLLFVILGVGLGTSFIAGGCVLAGWLIAALMLATPSARAVFDAPLTAPGLLLGITAFAVLEIVLSVPMWVGVVSGLGVTGIYSMIDAIRVHGVRFATNDTTPEQHATASRGSTVSNGQHRHEPVLTH